MLTLAKEVDVEDFVLTRLRVALTEELACI